MQVFSKTAENRNKTGYVTMKTTIVKEDMLP